MAADISLFTENLPPYNYLQNGELKGVSVDLVKEILRRTGDTGHFQVHAWPWAFKSVRKGGPDTAIFTIAEHSQRTEMFRWVGPLLSMSRVFFADARWRTPMTTLEEAKKYLVGVSKDNVLHAFLLEHEFPKISVSAQGGLFENPKLLLSNRIQLWLEDRRVVRYKSQAMGIDPGSFKELFALPPVQGYIAFSLATSQERIDVWNAALQEMKADGTWAAIAESF